MLKNPDTRRMASNIKAGVLLASVLAIADFASPKQTHAHVVATNPIRAEATADLSANTRPEMSCPLTPEGIALDCRPFVKAEVEGYLKQKAAEAETQAAAVARAKALAAEKAREAAIAKAKAAAEAEARHKAELAAAAAATTTTTVQQTTSTTYVHNQPTTPTTQAQSTQSYSGSSGMSSSEYAAWAKVNMCEEGGNWHVRGAVFSGGLGISNTNWVAYGGTQFAPTAADATPAEQITVAERIQPNPPDQNGACASW